MDLPTVYFYDFQSLVFSGTGTACQSPLEENVFLLPAFATLLPPPQTEAHEVARYIRVNGDTSEGWEIVPDYRGCIFYSSDDQTGNVLRHEINEIGYAPESDWQEEPPPLKGNALVQSKIWYLESRMTARLLREATLNISDTFPSSDPDFPNMTSAQALEEIQTQIAALRTQFTAV